MSQNQHPRLARNNFDLLRLLFAGTVCLIHAYELSGFESLRWISDILSATVAVKAFFIVSGFLIFMSYERSTSLASYAAKRIRRIYPAYFTVVMLCAVGLAAVSSKGLGAYFSLAWVKYVLANLTFLNFLQLSLPGVFDANRLTAVNGALWTLKIEVLFYVSVPFFVFLFGRFQRLPVLLFFYVASLVYAGVLSSLAARTGSGIHEELAHQLPGQLVYFMAGAFFYYFLPLFERYVGVFLGAAILILAIDRIHPLPVLEPFALAAIVAFFGLFLYAGNLGRYGDFSYGVYILHFPIIQLLLQLEWPRQSPGYFLCAVVFITMAAAVAMWHLVEKRFLLRGSHYIATTRASDEEAATVALAPESSARRAD